MQRTRIEDLGSFIGEEVEISGWVHVTRDQGKVIFLDIRDESGMVQSVIFGKPELLESAKDIRPEYVVSIHGKVNERPEKMKKADIINGSIELEITGLTVLNEAQTPPFSVADDTSKIDEEVRLSHRYLDLRTSRMQHNIRTRSEFIRHCREYLHQQHFVEIETPLLTESTPEGSRDFVVPSRHHPGNFYALPQSPQQYKQLLMNGGFERYMQLARALRDEDLRADRGFEHTQLDLEMAFMTRDDILHLVEGMIIHTVETMGYTIKQKPFPRISYEEAMNTYGADKFDLRSEEDKASGALAYAWVIDFPFFEQTDSGEWTFTHNPFSLPNEEHLDDLLAGKNVGAIKAAQYDLVCNGYETGGGSIRAHKPEIIRAVYRIMGYTEEQIEASVGHILKAFTYGAPPHGGIALGIERNIMNLTRETQLREVQAFPMTRRGHTAVMNAPKPLTSEQLTELHLHIENNSDNVS